MNRHVAGLFVLQLFACATARIPRVGGDPPPAVSDFEEERSYQSLLQRYTRSQAIYDNLQTNVFFHATWQAPAFVTARIAREANFRAMSTADTLEALKTERQRLAGAVEFHLAVHANNYRYEDFDREDSMWHLIVEVDGQQIKANKIERLGRTNVAMRSLYLYMEPFWVGYRVRFPLVPLQTGKNFIFRLASALGQAELCFLVD